MSPSQARLKPPFTHLHLASQAFVCGGPKRGDDLVATNASMAVPGMRARRSASSPGRARLLGLLLVSLGPALFWTGGLALAGKLFGFAVTTTMLAGILVPVFGFLLLACSPCFLRPEQAAEALA